MTSLCDHQFSQKFKKWTSSPPRFNLATKVERYYTSFLHTRYTLAIMDSAICVNDDDRAGVDVGAAPLPSKENENENENKSPKPKRRKLGRAARRRKNKVRAIEHALQSLLCGNDGNVSVNANADENLGEEVENDNDNREESSQLPSDRNRPLPGAIQRRQEMSQQKGSDNDDNDDEAMLVSQLGYMPGNAIGVVGRAEHLNHLYPELYKVLRTIDAKQSYAKNNNCNDNEGGINMPTALKLYPLVSRDVHNGGKSGRKFKSRKRGHEEIIPSTTQDDEIDPSKTAAELGVLEPFPTMYWLTHKFLRTMISQLELGTTNNVTQMEQRLSSSPAYLETMKNVHESYGTHRWNLLTDDDVQEVQARKWTGAIGRVRGVAGIRKHNTIKCLHTHAAHYLAFLGHRGTMEENLVGKWVLEAVNEAVKNMNIKVD